MGSKKKPCYHDKVLQKMARINKLELWLAVIFYIAATSYAVYHHYLLWMK